MTEFDKRLIEKAGNIRCRNYRDIDVLISVADTDEARQQLITIRWELRDLVQESL